MYHGAVKADKDGVRIFCLYDNTWHPDVYSCDKWTELSLNLNKEMRLQMAAKLRENEANKKQIKLDDISLPLPDKIKESSFYTYRDGDLYAKEQIQGLITLMFDYPEREFYLFLETGKKISKELQKAKHNNIVIIDHIENFYYLHPSPKAKNCFISIPGNNPTCAWQEEVIKKGPQFSRHSLRLTQKAKRDLEISYKNYKEKQKNKHPFELKPNFYGLGVDLNKIWPWIKKKFRKMDEETCKGKEFNITSHTMRNSAVSSNNTTRNTIIIGVVVACIVLFIIEPARDFIFYHVKNLVKKTLSTRNRKSAATDLTEDNFKKSNFVRFKEIEKELKKLAGLIALEANHREDNPFPKINRSVEATGSTARKEDIRQLGKNGLVYEDYIWKYGVRSIIKIDNNDIPYVESIFFLGRSKDYKEDVIISKLHRGNRYEYKILLKTYPNNTDTINTVAQEAIKELENLEPYFKEKIPFDYDDNK